MLVSPGTVSPNALEDIHKCGIDFAICSHCMSFSKLMQLQEASANSTPKSARPCLRRQVVIEHEVNIYAKSVGPTPRLRHATTLDHSGMRQFGLHFLGRGTCGLEMFAVKRFDRTVSPSTFTDCIASKASLNFPIQSLHPCMH